LTRELIATFFYTGYSPAAPGTVCSLAGLAFCLILRVPLGSTGAGVAVLLLALGLIPYGIRLGTWAERHWGRKDPQVFVFDEFIGLCLSTAPVFIFFPRLDPLVSGIIPLVFFRIFDVAKPTPVDRCEALPGGWGIMFDDIIAGVYAAAASVLVSLLLYRL